jgi:hypothetical protein
VSADLMSLHLDLNVNGFNSHKMTMNLGFDLTYSINTTCTVLNRAHPMETELHSGRYLTEH